MPIPKSVALILFLVPTLLACEDSRDYDLSRGPFLTLEEATHLDVRVSWGDDYADAKKLEMERRTADKNKFNVIAELPATAREYTDDTVKDSRRYRYRLRAFFKNGGTDRSVILVVDVPASPAPLAVAPDRSGKISPDGRLLARMLGGRVLVTDLASGSRTPATGGDLGTESGFCWTPDSRHLVIAAGIPGGEDLYLTDIRYGESRALTISGEGAADPEVSPDGVAVSFRRKDGQHTLPLEGLADLFEGMGR